MYFESTDTNYFTKIANMNETPEDKAVRELLESMHGHSKLQQPREQVEAALNRLELACHYTGGSQVARGLLYSLADETNKVDGEDYRWSIIELRRFDFKGIKDALMLITWAVGGDWNQDMVYEQIGLFERACGVE